MKKKTPIWKWILGVILFPFVPVYIIITTKKLKTPYKILLCIAYFVIIGAAGSATRKEKLNSISIDNLDMFKDETKEISLTFDPAEAKTDDVKCKIDDTDIAELDGFTVKAIDEGSTTITCNIKNNKEIEATATINVKLTDEQIQEINEQKEEELRIKNNSVSTSEKSSLKEYVTSIIDSILKAPSTAEYPGSFLDPFNGWSFSKTDGLVTISSYVDAQNSFGATLRSTFVVQVMMNEDGSGKATYVEFDGEVYSGTMQ